MDHLFFSLNHPIFGDRIGPWLIQIQGVATLVESFINPCKIKISLLYDNRLEIINGKNFSLNLTNFTMPRFVVNMRKSSIRSQKGFLTISLTSSWNSKINREPLTNHHGIRMGTNSSRKKGGKKREYCVIVWTSWHALYLYSNDYKGKPYKQI